MSEAKTDAPVRSGGRPWPRKLRRLAIGGAASLVLFTVLGFFVAPPIARWQAEKQLTALLGRKVTIGRVRINPFALSLAVEKLGIAEPDGVTPFLGFARLYVNAEGSSLVRRAPVIKEIALQALRVHVVRTKVTEASWGDVEAAYNFSDILARLAAPPKSPEPLPNPPPASAEPPRFSLNNIHIDDAAVVFDDAPTGDHHEITGLSAGVPFASTLPVYLDTFVQPGLRVWVDGTPFVIAGRTKPFKQSLETVLELRLQALDLTRYVPFAPMRLPFALRSAELSLALDVTFVRPADEAPKVTVKGDVALEKIAVDEKQDNGTRPLLALERLAVTLSESDVSAPSFHFEKVLVSGLDVHLRKQRDGTLNVQHLAPAAPAAPGPPASPPPPAPAQAKESATGGPRFAVDAFDLQKTTVHFRDDSVRPVFETEVRDVSVAVRGLSNARGATARIEASLRAVPGGHVHQRGTLRLAPLGAEGKLTVDDVEPGRFAPYTRDLVAFDVASGSVRLGADYRFEARERGQPASLKLHDAFVEIANLALRRRGSRDDFFKLAALAVQAASLDLGERKVEVASIATHDGRVRAARDAKGEIDLATLVPPAPPPPATAKPAPARAAVAPSWTVTVARFDLDRWSARFDDRAVSTPTTIMLDPIALHLTSVSTAPGAKLGVDLRLGINKTGKLQVGGNATLPPVAANLRFDLKGLELLPLQPYFQNQESLLVTGGIIALRGQAAVKIPATGDPKLDVTADIDVGDLATVDRAKHEPLLKWRSFHVGGLHVASPPMSVAIEDIALTDFQSRLVLFPDARFNLQDALAAPGAAPAPTPAADARKEPAATAPAPMPVTVGQVALQGGQVTFTDRSIHPSYTADLTELAGRVSGLSSTPGTTAAVDIRGSVNRSGVLTIVGSANPLAKDLSLDVQVNLRDFELPPASPYTGRYAGYVISKGKLDLSLAYKIAAGKLAAQNKLVLDQFTFGDKVESPDATKLPVRLAVALLKDRRGVIDVDLPIAGSLADPQFRIWRAVLKVLGNLVVKAATAPFALIASAFGGGDELSHVEFPAGRAILDEGAQRRLGVLAKALRERPGISFEIQGGADPKQDREGLRRFLYERKLKAAKLAALVQTGAAVPSLDDLTLDAPERPALVAAAYKNEKFPKPKNAVGFEKSLQVEEQEKLMLVNTRVEDDELRALALRRATAVQALLAKNVPGGASRLFLVTPRLTAANVQLDLKKD